MSKIKLLSSHLVNQIAAGEVIERPFSVIKELVENSIDAKSTQINIMIEDGGHKSLQVFDNGIGMSKDDLELAESMMYSDVVVNLCSTITIDAAVFDTPIVCVNFDFRGKRPSNVSIKRLYLFDHYAKLGQTGGFELANSNSPPLFFPPKILSPLPSFIFF